MAARQPFRSRVRYFRPEQESGLAVVDIPADVTAELVGLKQMRVRASVNGQEFTSNTMPAGGGRLALSLNKQILATCGLTIGDDAEFHLSRIP
jgi:Domain of unknown function (DUF1905)